MKGFQVAPAELEAVLLENDDIADAAVVALQGDHEELPRAYVVLKDSAKGKVSEKDIQDWTAKHVAKHKRLDGGIKVWYLMGVGEQQALTSMTSSSMKYQSRHPARFNGR